MRLDQIFLFLTIALTGTVYVVLFGNILSVLAIIVLLVLFLKDLQHGINRNSLLTYIVITLSLGFFLTLHYLLVPFENDSLPYITFYLRSAFIGLFLVYIKSKNINLINLLHPVLKVIAIHALIAFILSFIVGNFLFNITTSNIYTNSFIYLFFYNSSFDLFGITFYRNQGIFWEPGILQIYMNILFFISSFIFKNRKLQVLSVFLIFTTYSTTGIGILLLQFVVILFSKNTSIVQKLIILSSLAIVTLPLFIFNYQSKLKDSATANTEVTSSVLRIYDFVEGVNLTIRYPITGLGLSEKTYQRVKNNENSILNGYSQEFIDNIFDRRSSNSIMYFLSRFGMLFSFFWFYYLFKQRIVINKKWLFFVIIILANFSEPLIMAPFFILIVCSGLYESFRFTNSQTLPLIKYVK
ncbi:MAG: hypothetical protein WC623_18825 [Pedobacter sp.]|uniref:hypothetical protein n=1 Tax=Pedobacter sp. TaxID=1411316 RepID=UPI003563258E